MSDTGKNFLALWAVLLIFWAGQSASAQSQGNIKVLDAKARETLSLRLKKNYTIYVDEYRKDIDAFDVRLEKEPDVGPNTTTLEWLLEATGSDMSGKEYKKNPSRLIGSYFKLKKDLWLLSDEEILERRKRLKEKKEH